MSETKAKVQKETEEAKILSHRHETLFLWDVRKSNPNGDPNGNEPGLIDTPSGATSPTYALNGRFVTILLLFQSVETKTFS